MHYPYDKLEEKRKKISGEERNRGTKLPKKIALTGANKVSHAQGQGIEQGQGRDPL